MMVINSSPLESKVQIFSFSKNTSTPLSFNFLTVVRGDDGVASKPGDAFGDDQVDFS